MVNMLKEKKKKHKENVQLPGKLRKVFRYAEQLPPAVSIGIAEVLPN